MKTSTQAVVIGGGVVGCSVLYHLTKVGWTDVMLLERSELTSGSTWHAAGGMHTLNGDPNVAKLQQYTIELYREIEAISGRNCGIHITGGVMLADSEARLDWLKMAHARSQYLGMDTQMISVAEAKELFPLMDERHFVGALYDALEGHVDPSGVTEAYAASAQLAGAEIHKHTKVEDLVQRADGTWDVVTAQGTVHAEHVVNAGGLWAREVGRMVGLELPVLAMEHMYLLTEPMPEVAAYNQANAGKELVGVLDFGGELYLRQEGLGMLMGTYEQDGRPWSPRETPWDFAHQLLPPDLERIAPSLEVGFDHYPAFAEAGIKQVINGPFTFAPDGNPLVGPIRGLRNYWVACGVMAGLSQGGGVGLALATWMSDGDPGLDIWGMDVARFGSWATMAYTHAKVRENYSRRFSITFPNEELPAARPSATTAIHEQLTAANAVWGAAYGIEHALWFQAPGLDPVEDLTFKRSNAFDVVAEECRAVRERVGMIEISNFATYAVQGSGAEAWLSRILTNRMPAPGRMALSPMLNHQGRLIGDFTVAALAPDDYRVFGSGVAEEYHGRWFARQLPKDGSVHLRSEGLGLTGLSIAGPAAREVLSSVVAVDVGSDAFRFLDIRPMEVGIVPALVGRITFTGDLGFEIWVRPEHLHTLYATLRTAGEPYGLRLFGARALDSLRLEKSFGSWAREYRPIYGPYEAGMGRFVKLDGDFIGRDAAAAQQEAGPPRRLVTFTIAAKDADVMGDEPIWLGDRAVGWVTSGGYAHWSRASVALGYVPTELLDAVPPDAFQIEVLGDRIPATVRSEPLFDPTGERMRA
jgi:dimethylglycine dehydrogenase